MTPNAPGLGPSSGPSGPSGPAGPSPTFLEPSRAISPDPAQGHREQDLAWSRSSTPNSSSAQGQGPASGQPKSILQPSHTHAAAGPEIGVTSQAGERAEKTAGATLEPEAATQAAGKGAGTGVEGSTRASEGGVRSIKLMDADKQGNHTQDKEEGGEKRLGGKSAGLTLPRRAQAALASAEIQMKFISLYTNEYHPDTNPDGLISLGVAENHLMDDIVLEKFRSAATESFVQTDLGYGDGIASRRLKSALGRYFDDYFDPLVSVQQDHLIVGNGCSAIFDQMAHVMCEPGDAILIPQPYYVAYTPDFTLRASARVEPVFVGHMDEGFEPDMVKGLERKVEELAKEGVRSRILVFTNPNNPLGRTYPRETILAVAKFAQDHDMYLVINEIYARSVYDNEDWPDAPPFVSSLSIDFEKEVLGFEMARLSVVYGMSKDFCANGLRVGVLVVQHNPELYMALLGIGFFGKISSLSDAVWSNVLNDRQWLESFLAENKKRLGQAATETREWFRARGVDVSRSNGGNFILVDLGKRLDKSTEDGELEISQKLSEAGVFLATGKNFKQTTPGWFRVTFCAEPTKLAVALERIDKVLNLKVAAS